MNNVNKKDLPSEEISLAKGASQFFVAFRRFRRNKTAILGLGIVICYVLVGFTAPFLSPSDPIKVNTELMLQPPTPGYPLGTDAVGRCVLSRILWGARTSLAVGVVSVVIAMVPGVALGLLSGYFGGFLDGVLMRIIDMLMALPGLLLALLIAAVLGPSLENAMIAVGLTNVPVYARIVRSQALTVKEEDFVEAARALGVSDRSIVFKHILLNCLPSIVVISTLQLPSSILVAASLSFLGLGVQPPTPEWGADIATGRLWIRRAWWISTFPGVAIFFAVLSLNMLGDGLRDALDPRLQV